MFSIKPPPMPRIGCDLLQDLCFSCSAVTFEWVGWTLDKYKNQRDAEFSRSLQLLAQVVFSNKIVSVC